MVESVIHGVCGVHGQLVGPIHYRFKKWKVKV